MALLSLEHPDLSQSQTQKAVCATHSFIAPMEKLTSHESSEGVGKHQVAPPEDGQLLTLCMLLDSPEVPADLDVVTKVTEDFDLSMRTPASNLPPRYQPFDYLSEARYAELTMRQKAQLYLQVARISLFSKLRCTHPLISRTNLDGSLGADGCLLDTTLNTVNNTPMEYSEESSPVDDEPPGSPSMTDWGWGGSNSEDEWDDSSESESADGREGELDDTQQSESDDDHEGELDNTCEVGSKDACRSESDGARENELDDAHEHSEPIHPRADVPGEEKSSLGEPSPEVAKKTELQMGIESSGWDIVGV